MSLRVNMTKNRIAESIFLVCLRQTRKTSVTDTKRNLNKMFHKYSLSSVIFKGDGVKHLKWSTGTEGNRKYIFTDKQITAVFSSANYY